MQTPTLIALAKQSAISRSLDVLATNVANSLTPGFRRSAVDFSGFMHAVLQGQTVSFPFDVETHIDLTAGPIQSTFNPLDVAVIGNDAAFLVAQRDGSEVLTRSGSLSLNKAGQLINRAGYLMVGTDNRPITVGSDANVVAIQTDGTVLAAGVPVGRLKLLEVPNVQALTRLGDSSFVIPKGVKPAASFEISSGTVENSNVSIVSEMATLIELNKTFELLQQVMTIEESRKNDLIEKLAQV